MMKPSWKWVTMVSVILLLAAGCGPQGAEEMTEAEPTPTAPASEGRCGDEICDEAEQADPGLCPQDCEVPGATGKCGDGVCDEVEQADPALCPADCGAAGGGEGKGEAEPEEEPGPEPEEEPEPEPEEESEGDDEPRCESQSWTIAIEARGTIVRTEPSADLFAAIVGGFVVNEDCRIRGTSSGQYKNCSYQSLTGLCSYDIRCPEFQAAISGEVVPGEGDMDTFRIMVDGSGILETGTGHCGGVSVPFEQGGFLQDAFGSAVRNGGGYLVEIVVPRTEEPGGVRVTGTEGGVDAVAPANLSYAFYVDLYRGTVLVTFDELWRDWESEHAEWDPMGESQGEQ
jgi:hypothetical protein